MFYVVKIVIRFFVTNAYIRRYLHICIHSYMHTYGALGQLYADDTQAYMHCVSSKAATTVRAMGHTLTALETWMASNRLCLNPAKTKFMWLGTPQQLVKLNLIDLSAEFSNYTFSSSVRDLGIILDQALTFAPHLNRLSRYCFYQLRQLRTVARSLSSGAAATLVHSFITIRLGYCLSLILWFAFCSPGQPKPCPSLCGASYRANTQIWSCVKLHAGGPSLAPNPVAYGIQGRLLGVAMSIGPRSDLPNRPLSTCIGFSK